MKNKFNIGDNVVFFYDDFGTYGDVKEEELYTKEEAIEFLKGVL